MTEVEHEQLVETYIENIKTFMADAGGLFPHITVFADKLQKDDDDEKKALIHIPIPDQYMDSDADKDSLVEEILPFIFEKVRERFIPYGVAWASEAWMRVVPPEKLKDYKKLPPEKEVLIISIDTDYKSETIIYKMKRKGYQVNNDGEFIDDIELIKLPDNENAKVSGRFVGLYQKLKA